MAIDVPLRRVFDYLLPPDMPSPSRGCRVRVPFGRSSRVGLIWPTNGSNDLADSALREITACIDEKPFFAVHDLELLDFAARYYHQPIGEVVASALPPLLRSASDEQLTVEYWQATTSGADQASETLAKKAPKQYALLRLLCAADDGLTAGTLNAELPGWRRVAGTLEQRGWILRSQRQPESDWREVAAPMSALKPTHEQANVLSALDAATTGFSVSLIDGVTGSGKTEIYLQRISVCLQQQQQVLVLVPEIGLTPQLAQRFSRRLGQRVAMLHSNLPDAERASNWLAAVRGDAKIVLGTRSAVFTPLDNPGLIIIDEEHDPSLKQHEGFRYHARDLAVWRARSLNVPVLLGSATPSLESLHNALQGRYQHYQLHERAGDAAPPAIRVIDMNRFNAVEGISQPVIDAMRRHLDAGNQVLVYLNRRGYAPTVICTECGSMADCQHCDAHMTMHAHSQQLQCHHCGARRALPKGCEACGAPVRALGEGTERVEEIISAQFADVALARIDSDTTQARGSMDKKLAAAKRGDTRILIGTQMLAKGHHLPGLTLVVILNADQGFFASDFRASERLAQTVVQVAGRAGRADQPGEVLIQSAFAHHPLLQTLVTQGYHAFAERALDEREAASWPPYSYIAILHAASKDQQLALGFLHNARQSLRDAGIEALGPAPASMARRAGRYRFQLLLHASSRAALQQQLGLLSASLDATRMRGDLRWSLDVDPQAEI